MRRRRDLGDQDLDLPLRPMRSAAQQCPRVVLGQVRRQFRDGAQVKPPVGKHREHEREPPRQASCRDAQVRLGSDRCSRAVRRHASTDRPPEDTADAGPPLPGARPAPPRLDDCARPSPRAERAEHRRRSCRDQERASSCVHPWHGVFSTSWFGPGALISLLGRATPLVVLGGAPTPSDAAKRTAECRGEAKNRATRRSEPRHAASERRSYAKRPKLRQAALLSARSSASPTHSPTSTQDSLVADASTASVIRAARRPSTKVGRPSRMSPRAEA